MTKKEMLDALKEEGIKVSANDSTEEIKKVYDENFEEEGEEEKEGEEEEADKEEPEVEAKVTKSNKNEATVTWNGNSRTYTKAIHGDDFKELAQEYATKRGGVVS